MFVSSAASATGVKPAIKADPVPTIQVTRTGTWCLRSTAANHRGSSPSRAITNQTLVTANINPSLSVAV
jgi:hypothetical protein